MLARNDRGPSIFNSTRYSFATVVKLYFVLMTRGTFWATFYGRGTDQLEWAWHKKTLQQSFPLYAEHGNLIILRAGSQSLSHIPLPSLSCSLCTHTHSQLHTLTLTLPYSHTHPYSRISAFLRTHSHNHKHSLSLSLTLTFYAQAFIFSNTLTHAHDDPSSPVRSHTHTHTNAHSQAYTHTRTSPLLSLCCSIFLIESKTEETMIVSCLSILIKLPLP